MHGAFMAVTLCMPALGCLMLALFYPRVAIANGKILDFIDMDKYRTIAIMMMKLQQRSDEYGESG